MNKIIYVLNGSSLLELRKTHSLLIFEIEFFKNFPARRFFRIEITERFFDWIFHVPLSDSEKFLLEFIKKIQKNKEDCRLFFSQVDILYFHLVKVFQITSVELMSNTANIWKIECSDLIFDDFSISNILMKIMFSSFSFRLKIASIQGI